ncbi:hypothetical protein LOCC1_G006536 [Lachnellula occidentalis]|uniref:Uncharacterized protein n=1 Tax=Lachnellula occidentalis TaxID=215460 RepID=A0A8H8UF36_9HELO|nr:hypothetical protein LOCC1_G006536 [Lachnellula occidentalis]
MSTSQIQHPVSHKRTSSAAGNSTSELPKAKRPASSDPNVADLTPAVNPQCHLQKIYVLEVDRRPYYDDPDTCYHGVYSTLQDANNALRSFVGGEYDATERCKHGTRVNGTLWWSSSDVGEGDQAKVSIKIWDVEPPGSIIEPADEWHGGRLAGQGKDSDSEWSAGEE